MGRKLGTTTGMVARNSMGRKLGTKTGMVQPPPRVRPFYQSLARNSMGRKLGTTTGMVQPPPRVHDSTSWWKRTQLGMSQYTRKWRAYRQYHRRLWWWCKWRTTTSSNWRAQRWRNGCIYWPLNHSYHQKHWAPTSLLKKPDRWNVTRRQHAFRIHLTSGKPIKHPLSTNHKKF